MSGTQPATQSKRDVQQQPAVGDEEVNAPPPASDDEVDDGKQQKGQVPPPPAQPALHGQQQPPLQGTQSAAQQSPPPRQVVTPSLEDQVRAIIDRSDTIMSCTVEMEGIGKFKKPHSIAIRATASRIGHGNCEVHLKDLVRLRALGKIDDEQLQDMLDELQGPAKSSSGSSSADIVEVFVKAREQEREEQYHRIIRVLADALTKFNQYQSMRLEKAMEQFSTNGKNGKLDPALAVVVDTLSMQASDRELMLKLACYSRDMTEFNQQRNLYWLTKQPVIKQKLDGPWVANCPYPLFFNELKELDALNKLIIDEMRDATDGKEPEVSILGGEPKVAFVQAVPPPFDKLKKKMASGGEPFLAIGQLNNGDWVADGAPFKQAIDDLIKRITLLSKRQELDSKRFEQELRTIANTVDRDPKPARATSNSHSKSRDRREDRQDQPRPFPRGNNRRNNPTGGDEPVDAGNSTDPQRRF